MLDQSGVTAAVLAYVAWGFFPIYWHFLKDVSAIETMSHRVIWSSCFYLGVAIYRQKLPDLLSLLTRKTLIRTAAASIFIAINWLTYVWSVSHGYVLETSLGYFINPIINVALASLVLKEDLKGYQKLSVAIAAIGVVWLTLDLGRPPWIALLLAFSFAFYGLVKKFIKHDAVLISCLESLLLSPLALAAAISIRICGNGSQFEVLHTQENLSYMIWVLLVFGGAVTGIPLLLFGFAAQRLPFAILGFFQFFAPTIQFLSALFFFHEPVSQGRWIGFGFIWVALAIFVRGLYRSYIDFKKQGDIK